MKYWSIVAPIFLILLSSSVIRNIQLREDRDWWMKEARDCARGWKEEAPNGKDCGPIIIDGVQVETDENCGWNPPPEGIHSYPKTVREKRP